MVSAAWRRYNQGAVIEQRIAELGQLCVGETAIDHLEGNALLWTMGNARLSAPAHEEQEKSLTGIR